MRRIKGSKKVMTWMMAGLLGAGALNMGGCTQLQELKTVTNVDDIIPDTNKEPVEPVTKEDLNAEPANQFSLDLLDLMMQERTGNQFVSPFSIYEALGLLSDCMDEGDARSEIIRAMHLEENGDLSYDEVTARMELMNRALAQHEKTTISVANSLWVDDSVPKSAAFSDLKERLQRMDGAAFRRDLQATGTAKEINQWASKYTDGMIKEINGAPFSENTVAVLLNAVYFDGKWEMPFDPEETEEQTFYGTVESTVDMMHLWEDLTWMDMDSIKGVVLPYKNDEYEMTIYMSKDDSVSIADLYRRNQLTEEEKQVMMGLADEETKSAVSHYGEVCLHLPKFEMEDEIEMMDLVADLGVTSIFNDAELGQLIDIDQCDQRVVVSDICQKTKIEVDEEGTRATAVTEMGMNDAADLVTMPEEFVVDHPFLYTITEKETGTVLFVGVMEDMSE